MHPFRLRPAGSVPLVMLHRYGVVPPVTWIVALYGTPSVPFGSAVNGRLSAAGDTVSVTVPDAVCGGVPESLTPTVNVLVPATTGVPLTVHVLPVSVRPAGSVPLTRLHRYGTVPPVTVIVPV